MSDLPFEIRSARKEDLPQINQLYAELIETQSDISAMESALEAMKQDFCNTLLVACVDNQVVGTIQCSATHSTAFNCRPFMIVEYFIVKESFRNHGIGRALLNRVEAIAQSHDCVSLLLVSAAKRTKAHKLYVQQGYDNTVKGFRKYL